MLFYQLFTELELGHLILDQASPIFPFTYSPQKKNIITTLYTFDDDKQEQLLDMELDF